MKAILKAIFELKKEIGTMSKDSINPFFKSKYFDINQLLEHIEPLAQKNGLVILQPILKGFVRTEIYHVESGEMMCSEIALTDIKEPQKVGSEITYFRRYTLQSLLGVQADDDDGNLASKPKAATKETTQTKELLWLNLVDKQNKPTKTYNDLRLNLEAGGVFTLADIRKKYKVSKESEKILFNDFNIK